MKQRSDNSYDHVNHPSHYNNYSVEVIDMMASIYGREATAMWCEMTAFKYRMRLGNKPDNPIDQDLAKEAWYLKMAEKLRLSYVRVSRKRAQGNKDTANVSRR